MTNRPGTGTFAARVTGGSIAFAESFRDIRRLHRQHAEDAGKARHRLRQVRRPRAGDRPGRRHGRRADARLHESPNRGPRRSKTGRAVYWSRSRARSGARARSPATTRTSARSASTATRHDPPQGRPARRGRLPRGISGAASSAARGRQRMADDRRARRSIPRASTSRRQNERRPTAEARDPEGQPRGAPRSSSSARRAGK